MVAKKRVRIIKKIRQTAGVWQFVLVDRTGGRYVWDKRPGYYFLKWKERNAINERGIAITNPCARFEHLKEEKLRSLSAAGRPQASDVVRSGAD